MCDYSVTSVSILHKGQGERIKEKKVRKSILAVFLAAVSQSGVVTGKAAGSAVISAMVNGSTVDCLVSVLKATVSTTSCYNVLILDASGSMREFLRPAAGESPDRHPELEYQGIQRPVEGEKMACQVINSDVKNSKNKK